MDNNPFCFLVFWLFVVGAIALKIRSGLAKAREEAHLKERNPEVWLRLKELEDDKGHQRHENRKMGVQAGTTILGFLLRMFQG